VHHEPGWRLPRHTALARRYNVSTAQIDAAISELVRRHLIRKLADGQLYRVSPAEYLVSLAGVPALAAQADPMGGELTCRSRQISWRRVPEDIGWALGIDLAEPICVARFLWALNGEPAAYATTYLPADLAGHLIEGLDPGASAAGPVAAGQSVAGTAAASSAAASTAAALSLLPLSRPEQGQGQDDRPDPAGTPVALHLEMQLPPPSVARSLRLSAGQSAAIMTVRFDDLATARPVALTVAVLRSDLFRIVVQSGAPPLPGGPGSPEGREGHEGSFAGSWTHAVQDWDS
jgi:DNA-binding GntR family transcriptional regulator